MELEKNRRAFAKAGYGICAISYDSVKILKHFADRKKITFPMLADVGSKVIKKFDIHKGGGLPFPGTYVVDRRGRVESKDFRESYRERVGMGALLVTELGTDPVTRGFTARTPHLSLTVRPTAEFTYPETAFTLVFDIKLKPKMHVYAPDVKGYIPVSISLDGGENVRKSKVVWPKSKPFYFKVLNETVPVFEKSIRVFQEITTTAKKRLKVERSKTSGKKVLVFSGTFEYQACDDKACFAPRKVPFRVEIPYKTHDWKKVPKSAR